MNTSLIFQDDTPISSGYDSEGENYSYKKRMLPEDIPYPDKENYYMTAPIEDFLHWAKIEVKDIDVKRYVDAHGNPQKEFNRLCGNNGNTWEIYLTGDWYCLDIDVWTRFPQDFVRQLPFTISSSKKRHYYCRIDVDVNNFLGTDKPVNVLDFSITPEECALNKCERGYGDILRKMWEPKEGLMYFPAGMSSFQNSFFKIAFQRILPYTKIPQTTLKKEALEYDEKSSDSPDEGSNCYLKMLKMLKQDYYEPFDMWSKVMWCLPFEDKYKEIFHNWSKQCASKYHSTSVETKWNSCRIRNPYGFQTLLKYCRIENKEESEKLCLEFRRNKRKAELLLVNEFTNTSVAKYFYQSHKFGYLFFRTWYELDKHSVWKEIDDKTPYKMRSEMYDFVSSKLTEYNVEVAKDTSIDEDERKKLHGLICNAKKTLGNTGFKNKVVEELETEYRDENLLKKLNANRALWAFNDYVIDLTTGIKRKIEASDYISITCGYDYPEEEPLAKEKAMAYLKPMFRTESDLNSALRQMASCLRGENWFEKLNIFQGTGGNGKGCFFDAMARVFENYWGAIPMEYWYNTCGKDAKSADIVGVNARYKRVLYSTEANSGGDETDKNAGKMDVEKVQKWTGRDEIECRDNFAKAKQVLKYVPYGTMVWNTNYIPEIPVKKKTESDALKRRLVVSEFPFNFVEKGEDIPLPRVKTENGDYEVRKGDEVKIYKLGNPQVKADMKTDEIRNALIHILLQIYNTDINAKSRIELSDNTKKFTKGFMDSEKDSVKRFMEDTYEIDDGKNINRSTVWDAYQVSDLFIEKMKALDFYKLVESLGFSLKIIKGVRVIGNIKLKREVEAGVERIEDGKPPM